MFVISYLLVRQGMLLHFYLLMLSSLYLSFTFLNSIKTLVHIFKSLKSFICSNSKLCSFSLKFLVVAKSLSKWLMIIKEAQLIYPHSKDWEI